MIWDVISEIINVIADFFGEKLVNKGIAAKDTLKIKGQIASCENVINRSYSAIGRKYFEKHSLEDCDEAFAKEMKDIANAKEAMKELKGKLEDIKNNS